MESKELSYILRHKPEEYGLKPDDYGYVNVQELLKATNTTLEELCAIVNDNTRFFFNSDKSKIRAAHGHSYPVKPIPQSKAVPPIPLYHGTSKDVVDEILKHGLKSMNRIYVHLSSNTDDAKRIGMRHGKPVVLVIDTKSMYADGFVFYKSENNVWLTNDIPAKYIKRL